MTSVILFKTPLHNIPDFVNMVLELEHQDERSWPHLKLIRTALHYAELNELIIHESEIEEVVIQIMDAKNHLFEPSQSLRDCEELPALLAQQAMMYEVFLRSVIAPKSVPFLRLLSIQILGI